jgi:hypothetical protein
MTIPQSRISDLELRTLISMVDTFEVDTCGKVEIKTEKQLYIGEYLLTFDIVVISIQHSHFKEIDGTHYEVDRTVEIWNPVLSLDGELIIFTDEQDDIFEKEILNKITVR